MRTKTVRILSKYGKIWSLLAYFSCSGHAVHTSKLKEMKAVKQSQIFAAISQIK